jgi:hypothetical protein
MNLHRDIQLQNALILAKQFASMVQMHISDDCWTGKGAAEAFKASQEVLQQLDRGLEVLAEGPDDEITNFVAMCRLNEIAGNDTNGGWPAIDRQIKLIESEFNELKDGVDARDVHEVRDGIQDILVTTYGMAWRAGFHADIDAAEVVRSNLSKFDTTEEDAKQTAAKYSAIDVKTTYTPKSNGRITFYVTHSAEDQTGADGKSYPKGKWLKSHRFQEPKYCPLHPLVAAELARK